MFVKLQSQNRYHEEYRRRKELALTVPCPYCHVRSGAQCRTVNGAKAATPHMDRFKRSVNKKIARNNSQEAM